MFVQLPFEVEHTYENGTSVTFPVGATINVGKYPKIARMLERYNKKRKPGPIGEQDKMVRASEVQKKAADGAEHSE